MPRQPVDDSVDAFELAQDMRPFNPELGWDARAAYMKTLRALHTTQLNKLKKIAHLMVLASEQVIELEVSADELAENDTEIEGIGDDDDD